MTTNNPFVALEALFTAQQATTHAQSVRIDELTQRVATLEELLMSLTSRPEATSPAPAAPLPATTDKPTTGIIIPSLREAESDMIRRGVLPAAVETPAQRQENPTPAQPTVVDASGWFSLEDAVARGFRVKRGMVMKTPNAKNVEHGTELFSVSGAGKKRMVVKAGRVLMAKAPPAPVQEEKPPTPEKTPVEPKTPVMNAAAQTTVETPKTTEKAKRVETPDLDKGATAIRSGKIRALTAAQAKMIWVLTGGTWDNKSTENYVGKSTLKDIWDAVGFTASGGEKFTVCFTNGVEITFKFISTTKQLKWSVA